MLKFWKIQIIIDALKSEEEANVIHDCHDLESRCGLFDG